MVRRAFPSDVAEGILRLWAERDEFLRARNLLPRTFCHRDSGRVNLFARRAGDGNWETVAIDWAAAGIDVIGEDITGLGLASVYRFGDLAEARERDAAVFEGYLEGLSDAGWHGDRSLLRLGYAAGTPLKYGLLALPLFLRPLLDQSQHDWAKRVLGRPLEDQIDHGVAFRRLLLGLADEARELMASISCSAASGRSTVA
jgi:hypothetical protein